MPSQIDHIVIAVQNLADASSNYERAGFTVTPGGEHTGGLTHNALISFADGTYFELIAFTDPDNVSSQSHRWWDQLSAGEGLVDFAVLSPDVGAEAIEFADRGVDVVGPFDGGRVRPDGQHVSWRTVRAESAAAPLPFVIEDQTPRELRVPDGPAVVHPAGFTGVAGIAIAVTDLDAARFAYARLFGSHGEAVSPSVPGAKSGWRFDLGDHAVELVEPGLESGPLRDHVSARGEGPVEVVLRGPAGVAGYLPAETTNGARIRVIS